MRHSWIPLALVLGIGGGLACADRAAEETGTAAETPEAPEAPAEAPAAGVPALEAMIVARAADIAWGPAPPSLPPGAEGAVIEGDPAKPGPLAIRVRFPANYEIKPHTHAVIEHVTVLSGTFSIGMGETMDKSGGKTLSAGDFAAIPADHAHYVWTGSEPVEFQIHTTGPFEMRYVNPADDPRNAASEPATASTGN